MASKSKSGSGGKATSSSGTKGEVITVRLSPKLKYGLELLSRKQHRSLSSIVTWSLEQMINSGEDGLYKEPGYVRGTHLLNLLWDIDYADRLVKIAKYWPGLMTYEEEKLVKTIKKEGWGWPKSGDSATEQMRQMMPDILLDPGTGEYGWYG